jgi:asparagine synthase (glutamine-hydrolysing)
LVIAADATLSFVAELADALGEPRDRSGAQLILFAWRRWGPGALDRLRGSFAFILWDGQRLILARDPLGDRPLHYRADRARIACSSLPLPLARLAGRPRADLDRIAAYLAIDYESGPRSFLAGVDRVEPGQIVTIDRGGVRHERYWHPSIRSVPRPRAQAVEAARHLLDRAVADALRGPTVALQLSGGLDSSLVVESAARQRHPGQRLVAITGVAERSDDSGDPLLFVDEAAAAAATAHHLGGVEHRLAVASAESPIRAIERSIDSLQRPLLNNCNLGWLDATYAAARDSGSSVLLQGLAGNFTISAEGGSRLAELAAGLRPRALWREASAYRAASGARWAGVLDQSFGWAIPAPLYRRMARWRRNGPMPDRLGLLRPDHPAVHAVGPGDPSSYPLRPGRGPADALRELGFVDLGLANHSVRERFGVELLDPTASRDLIELCLTLPTEHYFHDGRPRQLARSLLAGRVPDSVVGEHRRGVQGQNWRQGVELGRDELVAEVDLAARDGDCAAMFDLGRIRAALLDWPTDGWDRPAQIQFFRRDLIRAVGALRFIRWAREA